MKKNTTAKGPVCGFICLTSSLFLVVEAKAEPSSGNGLDESQNVKANPSAQYQFLVGEWTAKVSLHRPGQPDFEYEAKWKNYFVANGLVLIQEWTGPYAQGVELRAYDEGRDIWLGQNIYLPKPGEWYENKASRNAGKMVVSTTRLENGVNTLNHEIYVPDGPDRFTIRTQKSNDGGKSWQRGGYTISAERI